MTLDPKQPLTLSAGQLMELAREIGKRPRLSKEEREAQRAANREIAARGSATARAKRNREIGIPTPTPGSRLLVRAVPGVRNRRRCGIDFGPTSPLELTVSRYPSAKTEELRDAGEYVISEDEAERLLADEMLIAIPVTAGATSPSADDRLAKVEAVARAAEDGKAKAEAELAETRQRLAKLERELAALKPSDGRPERLGKKDEPKG